MHTDSNQDRVDNLFDQAVALPAADRESFLIDACEGDVDVLAEVRELLAAHQKVEQSPGFMMSAPSDKRLFHRAARVNQSEYSTTSKSTGDLAADPTTVQLRGAPVDLSLTYTLRTENGEFAEQVTTTAKENAAALFRPGTVIHERYQLRGELGRGGMGIVFLSRDLLLDRDVAIKAILLDKMIVPKGDLKRLSKMFQSEARLGAKLLHPAIATVFDYGFHGGMPYLVMEFVSGDTLRDVLRQRNTFDLSEIQLILPTLAQAIDLAHANFVVHRDLKPENIRVTEHDQFKILDLGLARLFREEQDWRFAGTPAYAAPEQCAEMPNDGRADQYALAIIVYEMLTGCRPFVAKTCREYLRMHIEAPPTPPREHLATLPESVNEAILRALSKDPEQRFQSCVHFAVAIGCQMYSTMSITPCETIRENAVRVRFHLFAPLLEAFERLLMSQATGGVSMPISPLKLFERSMPIPKMYPWAAYLARTHDAFWMVHRNEIYRWELPRVQLLSVPKSKRLDLCCYENAQDSRSITMRFEDRETCSAWHEEFVTTLPEYDSKTPCNTQALQEPVVVVAQRPPGRFQYLAPVKAEGKNRSACQQMMQLRAALLGANAVVDAQYQRLTTFREKKWRASGFATRSLDGHSLQEVAQYWFDQEAVVLGKTMVVTAAMIFLAALIRGNIVQALLLAGSPALVALALLAYRRPQLMRLAVLMFFVGGILVPIFTGIEIAIVLVPACLYAAARGKHTYDRFRKLLPIEFRLRTGLQRTADIGLMVVPVLYIFLVARSFFPDNRQYISMTRAAELGAMVDRGDSIQAIEELDKILSKSPTDSLILAMRGVAHKNLNHLDLALADFDRAISANRTNDFAFRQRALVRAARDPREAIADAKKAVKLNPSSPDNQFVHGYVLQCLGDYQEAIEAYTKAILLHCGERGWAYQHRGLCYQSLGRAREAEEDFERARSLGVK